MSSELTAWVLNPTGEVWTIYTNGSGMLKSPVGQNFGRYISYGNDGLVWIITNEPVEGGATIKWMDDKEGKWNNVPDTAAGIKIAGDDKGKAWIVTSAHEVQVVNKKGKTESMSDAGFALDVTVGGDGTPWALTTQPHIHSGNLVAWYDRKAKTWNPVASAPEGARRVEGCADGTVCTIDCDGGVWIVDKEGQGHLISPTQDAFADEIGVGPEGAVWAINFHGENGGTEVKVFEPNSTVWQTVQTPVTAIKIDGGRDVYLADETSEAEAEPAEA